MVVTRAPTPIPIKGFLVTDAKMLRIRSPAAFFSPSPIRLIPYINRANPPATPNIISLIFTPTPAVYCLFLPVLRIYEQNTPGSFYSFPVGITLPMIDYGEKDCLYKENRKRQRKNRIFSLSFFVFLKRF